MNDWENEKVTTELDRINLLKVENHTSLTLALADVYETPWEDPIVVNKSTTGIQRGSTS
jgi:replicative DNA helicase